MKNQKLKREFSAGCVVFKKTKDQSPIPRLCSGLMVSGVEPSKSKVQFLIGKHSGYHKWVLPKGLIEEGEHGWQTALRETEEEMGVKAKLMDQRPIHKVQYFYYADLKTNNHATRRVKKYQEQGGKKTKIFKVVSFYLAEYVSGDQKEHGWEMEEAGWFSFDEALEKMAFPGEKEALKEAAEMIKL